MAKINDNLRLLFELTKQNPDLEVIPMVQTDVVCGDDYNWWMGTIGESRVDEYLVDEYHDGCIIFKSGMDDLLYEELAETFADYNDDGSNEAVERAKERIQTMWTKCIVVEITI